MKPPILPPPLLSSQIEPEPKPRRKFTIGRIIGLVFAVVVSLVAANKAGNYTALPLFLAATFLPLIWLERLVGGLRRGVITNRIRTGSRTAGKIKFSLSGEPDIYHRQKMPFRFWATWLIECALWLVITPFFWVIVIGTIIEGGAK